MRWKGSSENEDAPKGNLSRGVWVSQASMIVMDWLVGWEGWGCCIQKRVYLSRDGSFICFVVREVCVRVASDQAGHAPPLMVFYSLSLLYDAGLPWNLAHGTWRGTMDEQGPRGRTTGEAIPSEDVAWL